MRSTFVSNIVAGVLPRADWPELAMTS